MKATGIAWFRREDDNRLRNDVFSGGHVLPPTWSDWHIGALEAVKFLEAKGLVAVKAHIDPNTFSAWCADRNLDADADARGRYASSVAVRAHRSRY
jgi:hypothetical protein